MRVQSMGLCKGLFSTNSKKNTRCVATHSVSIALPSYLRSHCPLSHYRYRHPFTHICAFCFPMYPFLHQLFNPGPWPCILKLGRSCNDHDPLIVQGTTALSFCVHAAMLLRDYAIAMLTGSASMATTAAYRPR